VLENLAVAAAGFAAAGIAAMLFFCEESNAGKACGPRRRSGSSAL